MFSYLDQSRLLRTTILGIGLFGLTLFIFAQDARTEDAKGIEVLASGPVHEAFAEPIVFDPKPGLILKQAPPELVEELPPDQKPTGANVVWIPGYWHWDVEQDRFLWVSGFWRTLPPGREWIPGYWTEVNGGWQWVSGFWANADHDETAYLPEPPETLEAGPSTVQPSPDHFWVPGCWYWRNANYVWRPGYWTVGQSDWMWSPAHYVWTPRGYVFVDGYWDYAIPRRGLLFAPVYFDSPFYTRPGFYYTPSMAVNLAILTNHFFVGVGQRHYYFGDYYALSYGNRGFYPWFAFSSSRFGYDPIYAHYHHRHTRTDRNWSSQLRSDYEFRRDHEDARPARVATLSPRIAQQDRQAAKSEPSLVQPLAQFAAAAETKGTLESLPNSQRTEAAKVAQQTREFTKQRMKTESASTGTSELIPTPDGQAKKKQDQLGPDEKAKVDRPSRELKSSIVKRQKSPIADAKPPDATNKKSVAPTLPESPKPDLKGQPKTPDKERSPAPKVKPKVPDQEKPIVPKVAPKPPAKDPGVPKVEPPKVRPDVPKTEPPPKVRPEKPKVEPPPKVRPEIPRGEPKPPKASPPSGDKPREPRQKPPKPGKEPK